MPSSPQPPSSPVNVPDASSNSSSAVNVPVPDPSSNAVGYVVTNQQYVDASGNEITETQFVTVDVTSDVQITEDLSGEVIKYYDDTHDNEKTALISQIKSYADEINCTSFQGKGTIDDYNELFNAAAKIVNESVHMQLDVDIEGFNEFAAAADDLSALFNGFIVKLENVSIIDDTAFLTSVANALQKICNLSKVFGKFKETILATSTVQLPKSAHDTSVILQNVVGQLNCAMKYITHFADSSVAAPESANLSVEEKGIITAAISTIDNWNVLCEQGVSIAMANDDDIKYISNASNELKQKTQTLANATALLKTKMLKFKIK
jgi:hypothetical protein